MYFSTRSVLSFTHTSQARAYEIMNENLFDGRCDSSREVRIFCNAIANYKDTKEESTLQTDEIAPTNATNYPAL